MLKKIKKFFTVDDNDLQNSEIEKFDEVVKVEVAKPTVVEPVIKQEEVIVNTEPKPGFKDFQSEEMVPNKRIMRNDVQQRRDQEREKLKNEKKNAKVFVPSQIISPMYGSKGVSSPEPTLFMKNSKGKKLEDITSPIIKLREYKVKHSNVNNEEVATDVVLFEDALGQTHAIFEQKENAQEQQKAFEAFTNNYYEQDDHDLHEAHQQNEKIEHSTHNHHQ